jgi:geranylgeranyl reductase family protein
MARRSADVIVVGSGPAGASAARHLAASGRDVLMLEKARHPRYKTCGGGLVGRAFVELQGLDSIASVVEDDCRIAEMHVAGRAFRIQRRGPVVRLAMRSRLDAALVEEAQKAGAGLQEGCLVRQVSAQEQSVVLETSRGLFQANFVLAADGATSRVAQCLGWPAWTACAPAIEDEIEVPAEEIDRFRGVARFDFERVPHGYAWVFPKKQHLSVGVLSVRKRGPSLHRALDQYLDHLQLNPLQRHKRGFYIPLRPRPEPWTRQRVLLLGDALGLADPITCEGISFALLSGRLAAEAVVEGRYDEASVAAGFAYKLRQQLLPELRAARILARILYDWAGLRGLLFRIYGAQFCEAVADVMQGDRSYRGLLTSPGSFLRLLVKKNPPAELAREAP